VKKRKPREIARALLERLEREGVHLDRLLAAALPEMEPIDRALCQELVYGVTRWRDLLDWLIDRKAAGRKQLPAVRNILRLGLYQLFWLDRVPDHAVVYEAVEQTREAGWAAQSGFVNALLRTCARERESLRAEMEVLRREDLALGWSHPVWLVDRWVRRWGEVACRGLLEWNNRPAEVFARVNTLRTDAGRLLERWRLQENVEYDFCRADWLEENLVFRLRSHPVLGGLGSFRDGWFYVQDPSTLLAVAVLDPRPGERILDLCAAPGGKVSAIAQRVRDEALVVARDTSEGRLAMLRENLARLGATGVTVERSRPDRERLRGDLQFDRVLVDAPCSNTGVIRRRVEVRWRIDEMELARLQAAQADLLRLAAAQLRPGGMLVYSTCSLESEENQDRVRAFLAAAPGFRLELERELLPFRDGVDGAYVAQLRKGEV
jgi:16S rRNA (cytosine967-C5)-methyltransferase